MTEPDSNTSETSTEEAATESQGESVPERDPGSRSSETGAPSPSEPVPQDAQSEPVPRDEQQDSEAATTGSSSGEAAGEGTKKKRRRRRKKKGAQSGTSEAPDAKAGHHHAPFLRFFSGGAQRKHAFSVGEVIAGRVERVAEGAIVVDLFGKASAIADVDEPREVPIILQEERPSVVPEAPEPLPHAGDGAECAASAASQPSEASAASEPSEVAPDTGAPTVEAPSVEPSPALESDSPTPTSDSDQWEFAPTHTSDLPYPDLGEADTVVGAQAFDVEADTVAGAQPYDPTVPPAEPQVPSPPASSPAPTAPEPPTPEPPTPESATSGPVVEADASPESVASEEGATEALAAETKPPPEDLSDADLTLLEPLPAVDAPEVGSIFRGRIGGVAESGHVVIVNRAVDKAAVRKALRAARQNHQRVQGVVYGFNRGGFDVLVSGVRAFCPASAMSLTSIDDPNTFIGQRCEFSLPQDKGGKRSIIVSRRSILEKEARKRARERMAELEVGEKLGGKVAEIRDYGVLVDLGGGLDGLVHMSEVSWSRGVRPGDVVNVGDEVDVQVVKVQPATRKDRFGRVSLSMRACQPDPWDLNEETLRVGKPAKGRVVRTTDFGAFVQIAENVEGLLHISELGGNKELTHAKQALDEGAEIDVVIERVDREQRRISLSKLSEVDAKAIEAGEIEVGKAPRSLKPGSHIAVVVKRVEHGGAQVQVEGVLGKRGRGFIPNRELQDVRGERRRGPSQGDVVEVKVIGTERDGTLRCSVRARLLDEERKAVRDYRKESAKQGLGTFGDLLKAKLGDPPK